MLAKTAGVSEAFLAKFTEEMSSVTASSKTPYATIEGGCEGAEEGEYVEGDNDGSVLGSPEGMALGSEVVGKGEGI